METQNKNNQHIEISSVSHNPEAEFLNIKEEPEDRPDLTHLPPLPDLIPLTSLPPPVWPSWRSTILEELTSLLECPVCRDQISSLPVHCCARAISSVPSAGHAVPSVQFARQDLISLLTRDHFNYHIHRLFCVLPYKGIGH